MFGILIWSAKFLSSLGAINLALIIFFKYDFVEKWSASFGLSGLDKLIYGIIGLAGIFSLASLFIYF